MNKISTFLLVILFSLNTKGQIKTSENIFVNSRTTKTLDNKNHSIKGSIYLNENFTPIIIKGYKDNFIGRFDGYNNEIEIKTINKTIYLNKTINTEVTFINDNVNYSIFKEDNELIFFKRISSDKISLLIKEKIKFFKEISADNGIGKFQPAEFKKAKDEIYLGFKDGTSIKLPKKRKEFLKIFNEKSKEVEMYIKENKLNFKNLNDLKSILNYYCL